MKEITLKEWSAYLPYGLKGELQFDKSEDFELQDWAIDLSKFKKGAIWKLCGYADTDLHIPLGDGEFNGWLWRNEYTYVNFHSGIKPILYDLSWLTRNEFREEILIYFKSLGIDAEIVIYDSGNDIENDFTLLVNYRLMGETFTDALINRGSTEETPRRFFEWLCKNHFNVFNLPDELIVRVSEDFNPYK